MVFAVTGGALTLTSRRAFNGLTRGRWSSERTLERYVQEGAYCLQSLKLAADAKEKAENNSRSWRHSSSQKYCQTPRCTHHQPQLPPRTRRRGGGGGPRSFTAEPPERTVWREVPSSSILVHWEVMNHMFADTDTDHTTDTVSTRPGCATSHILTRWCAELLGCKCCGAFETFSGTAGIRVHALHRVCV